jgi:hypothetical protein
MTPGDDDRPMRVSGAASGVRVSTPARFKLTAPIAPEDELAASVNIALAYLAPADAVITAWDLSNAKSAVEGGRKKRLGCVAGWPDYGVFWRGVVVLLELKRSRGGQLSPAQKALHPRLEAAGFPVRVVRSVNEALDAVSAAGVPLRGKVLATLLSETLA